MNASDEIKQKLDLVEVIREYVPVKAVGVNFQALCPFHGEKTPSLVISPEKQIWHCFGCGRGGDLFSFVMEIENLSFTEAVRQLAAKAGVVLRYDTKESLTKRNRVLDILELSAKYYAKVLELPANQKIRDYLTRRGLTVEQLASWQIGYSQESWDALLKFLSQYPKNGQPYTPQEIFEAGLAISKDGRGERYYDRFRGRIMFPIWDTTGNVIAFTARINPDKEAIEKTGKYINSPQGQVYDKSKILFALNRAKTFIKEQDLTIVVEGQMDAITCHNFGFKNVVASSGTALTAEQISLLKRYSHNIALCFDADKAGQLAADRGIKEAMAQDLNISIITIPNGKDPDECLRHNPDDFRQAVAEAQPMMAYYFNKISAGQDLSRVEVKKKIAAQSLEIISKFNSRVEADYWLRVVAEHLEIDEGMLRADLSALKCSKPATTAVVSAKSEKITSLDRFSQLSELFLAILLRFPDLIAYASANLEPDWLVGILPTQFYKNIIINYNKNSLLDYEAERANAAAFGSEQLIFLDKLAIIGEKSFIDKEIEGARSELIKVISELKRHYLQIKLRQVQVKLAAAEAANDIAVIDEIMAEIKFLNDELRNNQVD